jgi:hypothetical protein
MLPFDYNDNPVIYNFFPNLTEKRK